MIIVYMYSDIFIKSNGKSETNDYTEQNDHQLSDFRYTERWKAIVNNLDYSDIESLQYVCGIAFERAANAEKSNLDLQSQLIAEKKTREHVVQENRKLKKILDDVTQENKILKEQLKDQLKNKAKIPIIEKEEEKKEIVVDNNIDYFMSYFDTPIKKSGKQSTKKSKLINAHPTADLNQILYEINNRQNKTTLDSYKEYKDTADAEVKALRNQLGLDDN